MDHAVARRVRLGGRAECAPEFGLLRRRPGEKRREPAFVRDALRFNERVDRRIFVGHNRSCDLDAFESGSHCGVLERDCRRQAKRVVRALGQIERAHDATPDRNERHLVGLAPRHGGEKASWFEGTPDAAKGVRQIGQKHQTPSAHDGVDRGVRKIVGIRIELPELDVRQPALARTSFGQGEHGCGLVRRNHAAGWTDAPCDRQRGVADSGGDVDDRMAGIDFGELD